MQNIEIGFQYNEEFSNIHFCREIKNIYDRLQDEESKLIFENRIMYSLTDDAKYMRNIIMSTEVGEKLYKLLLREKSIYIYGAGKRGMRLVDLFPNLNWKGFYDRNVTGEYKGIPIEILNENTLHGGTIIISIYYGYKEVAETLQAMGVCKEKIIILREYDKMISSNMYFEKDILPATISQEAYFIDAGAFDGSDTFNYKKYYGLKNEELNAILYEPDSKNYENCKNLFENYSCVTVKNAALLDKNGKAPFEDGNGEGSNIKSGSRKCIDSEALDIIIYDKKIGMIKMDVEGSELKALKGMKKIITEQHPILAVSIYHKRQDIWELPQQILELNKDYIFYLRHYTMSYGDTVLYAIYNSGRIGING